MKSMSIVISLFIFVSSYSQLGSIVIEKENKTSLSFSSSINANRIILNTKITEKWSFQNELIFTRIDENQFVEIPILLKYSFTKRWSVFFGPKLDFNILNKYGIATNRSPNFGISSEFGTHYNFDNHFFGEIKFDYNFTKKMANSALGFKNINKGQAIKFRIGRYFY